MRVTVWTATGYEGDGRDIFGSVHLGVFGSEAEARASADRFAGPSEATPQHLDIPIAGERELVARIVAHLRAGSYMNPRNGHDRAIPGWRGAADEIERVFDSLGDERELQVDPSASKSLDNGQGQKRASDA